MWCGAVGGLAACWCRQHVGRGGQQHKRQAGKLALPGQSLHSCLACCPREPCNHPTAPSMQHSVAASAHRPAALQIARQVQASCCRPVPSSSRRGAGRRGERGTGGALTACSPASRLSARSGPASCRAVAPPPRCGPPRQRCRRGRQGQGREGEQGCHSHGEGRRGTGRGAGHSAQASLHA